ncbi:hypothetical protein SAMN06265371_11129 [Lutibacter agarilyticus]|uniref:Uncharacterized protein n=1 Tax=Lutibacter agarilyticus TaxID=1109740 RepID=A0A238YW59_9FLAO|nr:hypothetical protein [Lutibacter agarilyticus]SNR74961.1 hypothetical protein SAMN06265371_11129 [Lutibacter agarilyticus]
MKTKFTFIAALAMILLFSCETPEDSVIKAVDETKDILTSNTWNLEQFKFELRNDDIPPPVLFNATNAILSAGIYDLDDMVFDASDMRKYEVEFKEDGTIITKNGQIDLLLEEAIGTYFVFNERTIRINAAENVNYKYIYDANAKEMSLIATEETAENIIKKINDKLVDQVANGTPTKVGDFIADLLFNNEALQTLINDVVVSAIAGKLEFINEIDPDELADLLATEIRNALEQVEWHPLLTELILTQLENISNIDKDAVAEAIANKVIQLIDEQLSEEQINDFILPYIEQIAINSEAVSEAIATLISDLFSDVFNENNVQPILVSAWTEFTRLDEAQIDVISGKLTTVVEDVFINETTISDGLLPFTTRIDETSIFQMGALATETTASIENLINGLNQVFPDLNLSPNYESMQNTIKLAYIAIKPVIAVTGPEQAAKDVANIILSQFLTTENINNTFGAAIQFLQTIDPETAGTTLAEWLLGFKDEISEVLYIEIRDLLSPILNNLDPNATALRIASALNNFITENITAESVKNLILPLLEEITKLNAEVVAGYLAELILNLDIIKDNVTKEAITQALLPVLQSIQESNVKDVAQNIIKAIVNTGIVEDVITEGRVSAIISLLIYKATWEKVIIANNFKELSIILSHD